MSIGRSPRRVEPRWSSPQHDTTETTGPIAQGPERTVDFVKQTADLLILHKFAIDEVMTRLRIWSEEFDHTHEHDPIEHITSRVKRPEAIAAKLRRRGLPVTPESARKNLTDIAGIRVVCPFLSDVYLIRDLFHRHETEIVQTKDYIANPKPNGYRSLHLIAQVPVHLSERTEHVFAEIQIRTIAMDFWAAVEHELGYKSGGAVPPAVVQELQDAAETAAILDSRMNALHERSKMLRS